MSLRQRDGYCPDDEVWHFSEDPGIERFVPHVAATSKHVAAYVWACDRPRCPDYWFARQTPRAMAWRLANSDAAEADALVGRRVERLHVIEFDSLPAMHDAQLYAYRFPADNFVELDGFAQVSTVPHVPLGPPTPLATPWELHAHAGIPVLVVADLFEWWADVVNSTLGFSGIRLRNSPNYRDVSPVG